MKKTDQPVKRKRGRPPMYGATMIDVHVFLTPDHIAKAYRLDNGKDMSAGIRAALDAATEPAASEAKRP